MDNQLIRYCLDDLNPTERAAFKTRLYDDAELHTDLEQLQELLNRLRAERITIEPPAGLATSTLAMIAKRIADIQAHHSSDEAETLTPGSTRTKQLQQTMQTLQPARKTRIIWRNEGVFQTIWRRADVIVAASIAFVMFGLLLTGVSKLRHENSVRVCQNNLREVHQALVGYSDVRGGQFPQVGTANVPHAGDFDKELIRVGQALPGTVYSCPTTLKEGVNTFTESNPSYAYTLGYRGTDGELRGLTRTTPGDTSPIVADLSPTWNRGGHFNGQNVLFASGNVRFTSTPNVGYDGDNIYCNAEGVTRAGLNWADTSLGHAADRP